MAVPAVAALAAAHFENRRIASNLMIAAFTLFAVLGWVSILTIGIGFLPPRCCQRSGRAA
ncbi:hypothetical protein BH18ACT5_BH18ACT5_04780 [soil metagenome]